MSSVAGNLQLSALVALAFPLVVSDQALFVATILAGILTVVLMAPGVIPDLFPSAFALILADQPVLATALSAIMSLVVATHFNYVIVCQPRSLESGRAAIASVMRDIPIPQLIVVNRKRWPKTPPHFTIDGRGEFCLTQFERS